MVRVLRYPRMCFLTGAAAVLCGGARDLLSASGYDGWAAVLMVTTVVLLAICCVLMSSRFFLDERGVGVGFLLRVRRTPWHELDSVGVLCCNSRRTYLYGLYRSSPGFLNLLHCAPRCGSWGFVVPTSRRLVSAIITYCPQEINFSPEPVRRPTQHLRALWHQPALYLLFLLPASALAFLTGCMVIIRASRLALFPLIGMTLAGLALFAAGTFLLYRAVLYVITCPRISEEGVSSGIGLYMAWDEIKFGYVHRMAQVSGMFLLSQPLEEAGQKNAPPIRCMSMPDTSTLLLSYLTYCPYAMKSETG